MVALKFHWESSCPYAMRRGDQDHLIDSHSFIYIPLPWPLLLASSLSCLLIFAMSSHIESLHCKYIHFFAHLRATLVYALFFKWPDLNTSIQPTLDPDERAGPMAPLPPLPFETPWFPGIAVFLLGLPKWVRILVILPTPWKKQPQSSSTFLYNIYWSLKLCLNSDYSVRPDSWYPLGTLPQNSRVKTAGLCQ